MKYQQVLISSELRVQGLNILQHLIGKRLAFGGPVFNAASYRRDGAAVDDVLGARDRRGAVRDQEGDKLGHLLGLGRAAERDPSERLHESRQRRVSANAVI